MLSSVIRYILVEYGSKRLLKVFQPLLVVGILFHVMCHLLMCLVTLSPIEKVRVLEKRESDRNRFTTYFGDVYIKTQEVSFLKAVLVGLAPSFLSYWFFMYLLDVLLNTHVHIVTLFFLIFLMISLFFSANLSRTDLAIIPEAFDNADNSLYQLLLIFLSGLITWHLIRTYNLQLPHEIFIYLIIAGFYLLLKYGFKLTRYILSSINTKRHKPSPPPKRRLKSYSRPKYNLFKRLKKKKSTVKRSHLKRLYKKNEKRKDLKDFVGEEQNKNYIDKSFEKFDELLNINKEIKLKQQKNNDFSVDGFRYDGNDQMNDSNIEDNYSDFEVINESKSSVEKVESRFIPEISCFKLIDLIKKKIGIDNNEFDMYITYCEIKNINPDLIIDNLFQEDTIINLLHRTNIEKNKTSLIQAKRCTQIISLALLKYDNYDDLLKNSVKLTNLTRATLWSQIKKYIPILKIFNPDVDVKRWLPHSKNISYNLLKKKVETLSKRITGVIGTLIKPKNESEWLLMIKNKKRKSQIPIIVKCNHCNIKFNSTYNYIERERWNCNCTKSLYDSELIYDFYRLKKEIEELGKEITEIKGTLLTPSSDNEYIKMRFEQNKSPTQLKVKVKCNKYGKIWKTSVTSLVHHKNWCGRCTDPRVYSYTDILNLVKLVTLNTVGIKGILKSPENKEKFKILANKYIPSHIPLIIECGNCGNELSYITQYLKAGIFPCPCINLKYETILSWYLFKMFGIHFNHTSLQNVISSYSGRLEYDGFNNVKLNNNDIGIKKIKNYVIENPILNNISNYRTFRFDESEIDDFVKSFEKKEFKSGDNIAIDLSYGHLKFIYKNKKIILVKSQLRRTKKICILDNILKFAFEYNGRQHFEFPNAFHKKFEEFLAQVINDLIKARLSNENNIFLMVFPYWIDLKMNDPIKIQNYITKVIHSQVGLDLTSLKQYDHRDPSFGQYRLDKFAF